MYVHVQNMFCIQYFSETLHLKNKVFLYLKEASDHSVKDVPFGFSTDTNAA